MVRLDYAFKGVLKSGLVVACFSVLVFFLGGPCLTARRLNTWLAQLALDYVDRDTG